MPLDRKEVRIHKHMPKVKRRYRDAVNGEFVSKEEAEKRPKETVSEKIEPTIEDVTIMEDVGGDGQWEEE